MFSCLLLQVVSEGSRRDEILQVLWWKWSGWFCIELYYLKTLRFLCLVPMRSWRIWKLFCLTRNSSRILRASRKTQSTEMTWITSRALYCQKMKFPVVRISFFVQLLAVRPCCKRLLSKIVIYFAETALINPRTPATFYVSSCYCQAIHDTCPL